MMESKQSGIIPIGCVSKHGGRVMTFRSLFRISASLSAIVLSGCVEDCNPVPIPVADAGGSVDASPPDAPSPEHDASVLTRLPQRPVSRQLSTLTDLYNLADLRILQSVG